MHTKRASTNNKGHTQSCYGRQILVPREQGKAIFQKIRFSHISEGDNKEVGLARKANQRSELVYCSSPRSPPTLWASVMSPKRGVAFAIVHLHIRVSTRQREKRTATIGLECETESQPPGISTGGPGLHSLQKSWRGQKTIRPGTGSVPKETLVAPKRKLRLLIPTVTTDLRPGFGRVYSSTDRQPATQSSVPRD